MSTTETFPESPQGLQPLLGIPADVDQREAERRLYNYAEQFGLIRPDAKNVEWLVGMKIALGLEGYSDNMALSMVLLNAMQESEQLCGFYSPDLIIGNIFRRRDAIKEALAKP